MTIVVNVCHGWSCPLVTKCAKSDFNTPAQVNGWVRHYQAPQTGEHCHDFAPLKPQKYGDGPTVDDD